MLSLLLGGKQVGLGVEVLADDGDLRLVAVDGHFREFRQFPDDGRRVDIAVHGDGNGRFRSTDHVHGDLVGAEDAEDPGEEARDAQHLG